MIKIVINSSSRYPVDRRMIRQKIKKVLKKHGVIDEVELSIFVVGDRKMEQLNKKFFKREGTTDVISFPLINEKDDLGFVDSPGSKRLYLGDIFISYPCARKQAAEYNLLVDEEIDNLLGHGVKHLLGIHHD